MSLLTHKVVDRDSKCSVPIPGLSHNHQTVPTVPFSEGSLSYNSPISVCCMGGLFKTLTYQRPSRPERPNMNNSRP